MLEILRVAGLSAASLLTGFTLALLLLALLYHKQVEELKEGTEKYTKANKSLTIKLIVLGFLLSLVFAGLYFGAY